MATQNSTLGVRAEAAPAAVSGQAHEQQTQALLSTPCPSLQALRMLRFTCRPSDEGQERNI